MTTNHYEKRSLESVEDDVLFSCENCEEGMDTSVDQIPFRLFMNEFMGICPSYSLINNQLNVDVISSIHVSNYIVEIEVFNYRFAIV